MISIICVLIVVICIDRYSRGKVVQLRNREQIITIAYINSKGWSIPLLLVIQRNNHLVNQYTNSGLLPNQVIKSTNNRQINNETSLEQLKHFDKYITTYTKGLYRILVLDKYKSYESAEFQEYYKVYNIIILRLFPYLSYFTQPLDIRYFSILNQVYSRQIKMFIKAYINYITKVEFFLVFTIVYKESITTQNTQAGFRKAGLVSFNLQAMILKLNIKLQTLIFSRSSTANTNLWVSQTSSNLVKAFSQIIFIRNWIIYHQRNLLTLLFEMVTILVKGIERIVYEITLLFTEIYIL